MRVNKATSYKAAFIHDPLPLPPLVDDCLFMFRGSLFTSDHMSLTHLFQLVKRVYKGIPLQLRGQAWALLLDIEKVKQDNMGKYEVGISKGDGSSKM